MNDQQRTPEEERWRASVLDPAKAKRRIKYGYVMVALWGAFAVCWIVYRLLSEEPFRWTDGMILLSLLMGLMSGIAGVVNNRRIAKGRRPLGF